MSAFLTSLFKAVESNPRVALVYTLAIGKDGKAGDAYSGENQFIADRCRWPSSNHLVFLAADETRLDEMNRAMMRRLALRALIKPGRIQELAEHQQGKVRELETKSDLEVATVIQQAYRHVFYPARQRLAGSLVDLNHAAIDIHSASERPGTGQQQVIRALRDNANQKLRLAEDAPESPGYTCDRTPVSYTHLTLPTNREV